MKKPIYKKWWFCLIIVAVALWVIGTVTGDDIAQAEETNAEETRISANTKAEQELPMGSSKNNPYVLTVEKLVEEIETDIDAAKDKYNGKWVKITGVVTDYSRYSSDDLSGYYLYGNYGKVGLKIVCWQNKGAFKQNEKIGDACTCIGQVREISTVNSTEIGNCDIIFE